MFKCIDQDTVLSIVIYYEDVRGEDVVQVKINMDKAGA